MCAETPEGDALRVEGFKAADPNGNGLCSLAELETFVLKSLMTKYPKTGKGKNCTTLTLRKWLKRELTNRRTGAVTILKDVLANPNSKTGLGRKQYVYQRRASVTAKASAPRKAKPGVSKTQPGISSFFSAKH
jgi:hypothetical protein